MRAEIVPVGRQSRQIMVLKHCPKMRFSFSAKPASNIPGRTPSSLLNHRSCEGHSRLRKIIETQTHITPRRQGTLLLFEGFAQSFVYPVANLPGKVTNTSHYLALSRQNTPESRARSIPAQTISRPACPAFVQRSTPFDLAHSVAPPILNKYG